MVRNALFAGAALCAASVGPVSAQAADSAVGLAKPPWDALTDTVGAGEIVLQNVCLRGVVESKPIEPLALHERLVHMSPGAAGAGPSDKVWRLASINPVYAVAWADGSCSAYVDRGPSDRLRAMADTVLRARPEGFVRMSSGLVDNDRVERTIYCAGAGDRQFVATIATPNGRPARGVRALSSTVYRVRGQSGLCPSAPAPLG